MFQTPKKIPENLVFDIKTISEEKANLYSHIVGVVFILIFGPNLFFSAISLENIPVKIGVFIYLFSFFMLFFSSSMYHNSYVATIRKKLRSLDHISIYFFIVGTYTPIILIYINNSFGYKVLLVLWLATLFGSIFKIFFVGKFRLLSTIIYVIMGWTALFIINELKITAPSNILFWIFSGGVIYTLGTYFYINKKIKYNHLYWHLAVLAGAVCHFVVIYLSVS